MGLFLAMSAIVGVDEETALQALQGYARTRGGSLTAAELSLEDDGCLVVSAGVGGTTLLYPGNFLEWDDASADLSKRLQKPVFSFHIHDGDLWMYSLYEQGAVVDQFNPVPDYWGELDDDEMQSWQGNAVEVARRVPGLTPERIANYFVRWDLENGYGQKAYPGDQFGSGEDWQLVDFMQKLGFDYPVDDRGEAHGETYEFRCPSDFAD